MACVWRPLHDLRCLCSTGTVCLGGEGEFESLRQQQRCRGQVTRNRSHRAPEAMPSPPPQKKSMHVETKSKGRKLPIVTLPSENVYWSILSAHVCVHVCVWIEFLFFFYLLFVLVEGGTGV